MSYYLAPSLVRARIVINARWPHRDHTSDGWIGDAAHQGRVSDHNPNARGSVNALDVDVDGIHVPTLIAGFLVHPATHYVIHNRRIYNREMAFRPAVYTGDNPHIDHVHESIRQDTTAENDPTPWVLIGGIPSTWRELRQGTTGRDVYELQAILNGQGASLRLDGTFGPYTDGAVRTFQRVHHVAHSILTDGSGDGIVGPATRAALFTV